MVTTKQRLQWNYWELTYVSPFVSEWQGKNNQQLPDRFQISSKNISKSKKCCPTLTTTAPRRKGCSSIKRSSTVHGSMHPSVAVFTTIQLP